MPFRLVVFDLDGTLVDSLPDIAESCNSVLKEFGCPLHALEDYRGFVGWGLERTLRLSVPDNIQMSVFKTMYEAFLNVYQSCPFEQTQPYKGVPSLIDGLRLRGTTMLVYTNKHEEIARKIVSKLFPADSFWRVIGHTAGRPSKPDAKILREYMTDNGLGGVECLMVGDSHVDMHTAQNAGMNFAAALWGFDTFPEEWNLRYSFEKPEELNRWLAGRK